MPLRHACLLGLAACAGAAPTGGDAAPVAVQLDGTIAWEAHLERPHAVFTVPARLRLWSDGRCARLEMVEGEGSRAETTLYVRDAGGACRIGTPDGHFHGDDGEAARLLHILCAATAADRETASIAWQHPRLGDVTDRAVWQETDGGRELRVSWHRRADQGEMILHRSVTQLPAPAADAFLTGGAAPAIAEPAEPRFRTIAPFVHEITLPDAETRSLAVEFADHLVLCETSLDNPAGERLLATLDRHLPGKPVRFVLFGHYHPHYTGGLRPAMARGAIVVAPPLGAAYAREIAARPFRDPPDALVASGRKPVIETFTGERAFRDDTNELVAIDIGQDSHHTVEYVVFWLPHQKILFEGDLGWFEGTDGKHASGSRARGLVKAIDDRRLPVATLVQSWPVTGESSLPLSGLRALLVQQR